MPAQSQPSQNLQEIKYFLYARKSTDEEDKQVRSIQDQLIEVKEYASKENLFIVDQFTESQTAKVPGRPVFNLMLEQMEKEGVSGIVAWHPDRLARNSIDGGRIVYLLDQGIITSLKFPTFWFEPTPQGKFFLQIAFGQSKYFSDNLSENIKRAQRQKCKRGEFPGWAPPGYLNDPKQRDIIKDPIKFEPIKKAFKLYSTGNYTYEQISLFLAKNQVLNRKGNSPLAIDVVKNMLANPFYYGVFKYNKELYEGSHLPIVSKKLFDKVQSIIKKRSRPQKRGNNFAFTNLFKCGECGYAITAERKSKYYKGTNRTATYIYYRCTKKGKRKQKTCNQLFTSQKELVKQINQAIQKVSLKNKQAEKLLFWLKKEENQINQTYQKQSQALQKQLFKITAKLERLLDLHLEGEIVKEHYLIKKANLINQKTEIKQKLSKASSSSINTKWLGLYRSFIKKAALAVKIAGEENNFKAKRQYLSSIGSDLTLKNKKIIFSWQKPWASLAAHPTNRNLCRGKDSNLRSPCLPAGFRTSRDSLSVPGLGFAPR